MGVAQTRGSIEMLLCKREHTAAQRDMKGSVVDPDVGRQPYLVSVEGVEA